jgi:3-deoxy-D-manno-octulosonate 8-phosphate phosphatase (KDO 8-P phosphatase)
MIRIGLLKKTDYICPNLARVQINPEISEKARQIKAILFDVDGVLTDGGIVYDNSGQEYKRFNVKDGQIIKYLKQYGILTGVITGRASAVVKNRCEELKIDIHYHGISDKRAIFEKILAEQELQAHEVAYIGDDINDLPVLTRCGLSATPADGHEAVKPHVDWVLEVKGGEGALRALGDLVLKSQGHYARIIEDLIR